MMLFWAKYFLAVLTSAIFLFCNLNLRLGTHICGGHAMQTELGITLSDLGCGMEMEEKSCENNAQKSAYNLHQKECCSNEFQHAELSQTINNPLHLKAQKPFISTNLMISQHVFQKLPQLALNTISGHPPPLVFKNILTLFQIFLL